METTRASRIEPRAAKDPPTRGAPARRLVVVSNRLPFTVEATEGAPRLTRTVGGLVSGVEGYLGGRPVENGAEPHAWVGWPGVDADADGRRRIREVTVAEHAAWPVFLEEADVRAYYEGFCNGTLWPLAHYFPSLVRMEEDDWAAYVRVNERFRDAVLEVARPGDVVWVHDFHLMLLPRLLRERAPDLSIAFFLHVPFPAFEVFRILPDPWARELLRGVLGADVAGFHTHDYARHFLRSADRLLGVEARDAQVRLGGHVTCVDAFPIGIDFDRLDRSAADPDVQAAVAALAPATGERRIVLSVDRLDYTKGILNRLLAFERLLETSPAWHARATLVAVAVPSRERVDSYRRMRTQIEQTVGRINGRFGRLDWTPVVYQFRALAPTALRALYLRADVALVTPLRDGMNLIAKEYLATRSDGTGVLVLSDTAGAARELGEAVLVNPYHVAGIAEGLARALDMPVVEQRERNAHMRTRLRRYDVVRWGEEQLERLARAEAGTRALRERRLLPADLARLHAAWSSSSRRLVLLDYDGTLVPFASHPSAGGPDAGLLRLLDRLARAPGTDLVLISGRDGGWLERWFGGLPLALVAEHGARVRDRSGPWEVAHAAAEEGWTRVVEVLQVFADRLPGAFVEPKGTGVAWHWRNADPEIGAQREAELVEALGALLKGGPLGVLRGSKVVEVRGNAAHKGAAAGRWLGRGPYDLVLAAGDDTTDEDLFAALPATAWSIRVGLGETRARFNVTDVGELRRLLEALGGAPGVARHPADPGPRPGEGGALPGAPPGARAREGTPGEPPT